MDEWRTFLYPLGFLSALAFGARFIIQWLLSEKAHKSIVPRSFWQLSLLGNFLLLIHSFIQVQYPICMIQVCNAVISWRNLDLMQKNPSPVSLSTVIWILTGSLLLISLAFASQNWLLDYEGSWFRIPKSPWQKNSIDSVSFFWHLLGTLGTLLFSSRFWVQWWFAERAHASTLPLSFWWLSLSGALLSIAYFIRIGDSVNLIGPLVGLVPYIRNLMLLQKAEGVSRP